MTMALNNSDPAFALIHAIRSGNLASLRRLLSEHPGLDAAPIGAASGHTPLHVATERPGYYPGGPAVVAMLIAAGVDPNAGAEGGPAPETPCTGRPAATTPTWPRPSSMAAPTSRRPADRSAPARQRDRLRLLARRPPARRPRRPGKQAVAGRGAGHAVPARGAACRLPRTSPRKITE